jgi:hypothetical protein
MTKKHNFKEGYDSNTTVWLKGSQKPNQKLVLEKLKA